MNASRHVGNMAWGQLLMSLLHVAISFEQPARTYLAGLRVFEEPLLFTFNIKLDEVQLFCRGHALHPQDMT